MQSSRQALLILGGGFAAVLVIGGGLLAVARMPSAGAPPSIPGFARQTGANAPTPVRPGPALAAQRTPS